VEQILIIDDDVELCELVSRYLRREGFAVEAVTQSALGIERARSGACDLVVLDVMMPGLNGFEVLKQIRASTALPVLMLTARGEDVARIIGLELGADDYLAKPYNPRELVARIRAILRRTQAAPRSAGQAAASTQCLSVGDVVLDVSARHVTCAGRLVHLTTVEFDLLHALLAAAGRAVSREELYETVLGRTFAPFDRVMDNHISNLRRKLGPDRLGTDRIKTVRNAGYQFALPSAPSSTGER
jgi:two-component system response regulator CpxR